MPLLIIIAVVILLLVIINLMRNPMKLYSQRIANAQLKTYLNLIKRSPRMPKNEIYIQMIDARLGYSREDAEKIVEAAENLLPKNDLLYSDVIKNNPDIDSLKEDINLQKVVHQLICFDYEKNSKNCIMNQKEYLTMFSVVNDIIPENY
jgi:hypothetical protein